MSAPRKYPTSSQLVGMITRESVGVTPEEAQYDQSSMTEEDYDEAVYSAFLDLASKPQRFHKAQDDPSAVEHPEARLRRIGHESIEAGKPSPLYLCLLELLDGGATLPRVTGRSLQTAQKHLMLANKFVTFLSEQGPSVNFKDAKAKFRIYQQLNDEAPSQATVDDTLATYNLDWSAYSVDSPRKSRRSKKR